jgi:hypothetical protein
MQSERMRNKMACQAVGVESGPHPDFRYYPQVVG